MLTVDNLNVYYGGIHALKDLLPGTTAGDCDPNWSQRRRQDYYVENHFRPGAGQNRQYQLSGAGCLVYAGPYYRTGGPVPCSRGAPGLC